MFNVPHTVLELSLALYYVFIMFIIINSKARTLKNAFFSMFVATGVADVISLISICFIRMTRELGLGAEFQQFVLLCIITSGICFSAHMLGNMLIAINRYSAICLMQRYDKIWARRNVWIAIGVQYGVAFLACIHLIRADLVYIKNVNGTSTFKGLEKNTDMASFYFTLLPKSLPKKERARLF